MMLLFHILSMMLLFHIIVNDDSLSYIVNDDDCYVVRLLFRFIYNDDLIIEYSAMSTRLAIDIITGSNLPSI